MAHRLFKGVLSIILLCVCFEECSPMGDEDFHLALKQAIQRLLQRHATYNNDPVEQRLTGQQNGFPEPHSYVLPNAILWEPHQQLPHFFQPEFVCPICNEDGKVISLKPIGWKDGRLRRQMPRQIYGMSGRVLLISRVYRCSAGHELSGHDPAILAMINSQGRIPFLLSHKTGVTRELLDMIVSMVRNGLSFSQINDILLERIHMRHLKLESKFLEDLKVYSASHPIIINSSFPEFNQQRECPSRNTISEFFLHYFDLNEDLFVRRMTSISADAEWLSCDHTFDITSSIGYERTEDRKWIRQYDSLFCVMNERGQIATWQLTQTQGFETVRGLLQQLFKRLSSKEKSIKEFYIDNCCHWRKKLQEVFGPDLAVKLDIFHAFQRISSKISKRHPFYGKCLQDLRLMFRDPSDVGKTRAKETPDPNTLLKNADMFLKKWENVESDKGRPVLSEEAVKEVRKIQEHMRRGCLSGIAPGRGTNRNEALHRWIGDLLSGSKVGVRLAYALLMIIFDRINNKGEKSTCELPEETCVRDERSKLTEYDQSETRLCETPKEVFGIGLVSSDADEVTETTKLTAKTHDDDSHGKFSLNYSSAINILDRAQLSLVSFQSLVNLSESGTEISHRHFPYLNTSITLFYNSHFSMNRDSDEHDKRIDNILKSWSMSREHIAKDGDCCFRAVARNVSKLTETGGLSSQAYEHLANLGLVNLDEESLSDSLRVMTVSEWSGENRPHYESFLTTDNFDQEVKRFTHKGYFTGELGNLMILAMANVLKMPIVIFSSLENYPTIPILPRGQLNDMPTLFVSFNAAGCGHYDYVHTETVRMVLEKQQEEQANEKKRPQVSCSCGASKKGQGKVSNVCNNAIGSYSSRCKCLKARISCDGNCKCKGCSNPFGQSQAGNTEGECAPRKRRKFDIQNAIKLKSKAYLNEKGEPLREGALTKEEFFVVEELFKLFHENGEEMRSTSLLAYYNFIQSTNCTLDPRPLLLRPMSHEQIKRAITAHDHDASVMTALFKKQVELCFAKS